MSFLSDEMDSYRVATGDPERPFVTHSFRPRDRAALAAELERINALPAGEAFAAIRRVAVETHQGYPQYDGHWDGPEWLLVRFVERWWSKGEHSVFEVGDLAIARHDPRDALGEYSVFCVRSCSGCLVERHYFEAVQNA